ncbi:MAG: Rrf2 family protein [Myxococcota bacterium]|jgi:Rrf2 family protein
MYGKATETAIAAMSRLAETYDEGTNRISAIEIADSRKLQRPFVGKVLTSLSQAGLVLGSRGPGGGFTLAHHPREITIKEIFDLFEREDEGGLCPFGGGVCGVGVNCALHDKLVQVNKSVDDVLYNTTLEVFRKVYQDDGIRPTQPEDVAKLAADEQPSGRESFRAPYRRKGF